jgi:hypothetical protein
MFLKAIKINSTVYENFTTLCGQKNTDGTCYTIKGAMAQAVKDAVLSPQNLILDSAHAQQLVAFQNACGTGNKPFLDSIVCDLSYDLESARLNVPELFQKVDDVLNRPTHQQFLTSQDKAKMVTGLKPKCRFCSKGRCDPARRRVEFEHIDEAAPVSQMSSLSIKVNSAPSIFRPDAAPFPIPAKQ